MKNTTSFARVTLATVLAFGTAVSYAAAPAGPIPQPGPTAAEAIAAAETLSNNLMFQYDPNLANLINANLGNSVGQAQIPQIASTQTQTDANSILSQIMYSMYPSLAANNNNSPTTVLQNLTVNAPGPDSLTLLNSNQQPVNVDGSGNTSSASSNNPTFMNFGSVMNTAAFDSTSQASAQNFLNLVSDAYEPVVTNQQINYVGLGNALNSKSLSQKQKIEKLQAIQNSPDYQTFQAGLRAQVAEKSVALNIFNTLIAERTPVAGLGANIGLSGQPASPLQVESYLATTARVNNPAWYQSMQAASPATVQRETLYVLAEIENQLYQLHMDNEQSMTALATLVLQQASASKMLQQTSSMPASTVVNQQISGAKTQQAQANANDQNQAEQEQQQQEQQQQEQQQQAQEQQQQQQQNSSQQ